LRKSWRWKSFGQIYDEAIQVMNRSEFPKDMHLKIDVAVEFKTPTGDSFVGCIDKIDGDEITVNFNHPLAGCDVSFQVEILEKHENSSKFNSNINFKVHIFRKFTTIHHLNGFVINLTKRLIST
jgi:FKBP-type peptidyl-prolyl cis-trans isomerase 2